MAITSIGYDGTVDETQFEKIMGYSAASKYGVNASGSFKASTVAGQVLQSRVVAGSAWTSGVVDIMDADATVQFEAPASGTRWDMIVLRRNYQPPGGASTLEIIKGGSAKAVPSRNTDSGALDDQPLWLVRLDAGKTAPSEYVDLRVFARNGGCTANDDLVRGFMGSLGTQIEINGTLWIRRVGSNGTEEWARLVSPPSDSDWVTGTFGSGWGAPSGVSGYVYSRKVDVGPVFMIEVRTRFNRTGGTIDVFSDGNIADQFVAQIPTSHAPSGVAVGMTSGVGSRTANGYVGGNGRVILSTVAPAYNDAPIVKGDYFSLSATYFRDK